MKIPRYGAFTTLLPLSTRNPTGTLGDLHGFEAPSLIVSQRLYVHATHVVCGRTDVTHARTYPITMRVRTDTRICTPAHICASFIKANMNRCTPQVLRAMLISWGARKFWNAGVAPNKYTLFPPIVTLLRNAWTAPPRKWWKVIGVKQNVIF